MSDVNYDVIIIGAGPAGYVAAIRSAQLGLKVACVDNAHNHKGQQSLGGTYINAGCIASMSLLESSKLYYTLMHDAKKHGINVSEINLDINAMQARKNKILHELSEQIKVIFNHYEVTCIYGQGYLLNASEVEITPIVKGKPYVISAKNIILANGSKSVELPCAKIDNKFILNSCAGLAMTEVPKRLGIIGAGIIGLELAGIWRRLGADVILLEAQEDFLTAPDFEISRAAYGIYTAQGLDLRLGARVISAKKADKKVILDYQDQDGIHHLRLDKLIVASGRCPNTEHLAAPEADLLYNESGFVHVDENCCTNIPGVYAIGDLTLLGPMLAHKGLEEGVFVAEHIVNQHSPINYNVIPCVIYTDPEIAWVGQTEQTLQAIGENYKVGTFPLKSTGRAQAIGQIDGMVKIISHATTDIILGVHILGAQASELIAEAVVAMEFSASSEDLSRTIHAHPSISEAIHEAALNLNGRSLHIPPV